MKISNNNLIKYTGSVNGVEGYISIDSGATNNFLSTDIDCSNKKNLESKTVKFTISRWQNMLLRWKI